MRVTFTKLFALLLLCCLYSIGSKAQEQPQWIPYNLGGVGPNQTAMGVNQANGTPYVLYSGAAAAGGTENVAQVKMKSGTEWVSLGSGTPALSLGAIAWSNIVISPEGVPYIAFRDGGDSNKAKVFRYNATSSTWENIFTSEASGLYTTLAFHGNGTPYLTFIDGSKESKAVVMRYTGTAWEPVGPAEGVSAGAATFSSIAFDSNNNLYLVTTEGGSPVVRKLNGTTWETVGGTSLAGVTGISNTDIAIGPNNIPYILFRTGATNATRAAKVMKLENNAWVNVGAATGFGAINPAFSHATAETIDFMNIEVGNDNVPFVGMMENNMATNNTAHNRAAVYRFNATTSAWEPLGGGPPAAVNSSNEGFALYKANNTAYISARDTGPTPRVLHVWQFNAGSTATSAAKDVAKKSGVSVYPNPSSSSFQFSVAGKFSYTVYNSAGQVMESGHGMGEGKVGAVYKAGLYFIKLRTEAGNQTLKLLKQ